MSVSGKNMRRVYEAKQRHDSMCDGNAHTVAMHPVEIDRNGWDEGDVIAGLVVKGDFGMGTGTIKVICDRDEPRAEGATAEKRELVPA